MTEIQPLQPEKIGYLTKLVDHLVSPEHLIDFELLLENCLSELSSCYLNALCTKESSFLLEKLFEFSDDTWILRFVLDLVGQSWPNVLTSPYASRVFEAALKRMKDAPIELVRIKEFVAFFTKDVTVASLVNSKYASKSLKQFVIMLGSQPGFLKIKIQLRRTILQYSDLEYVTSQPHGSSLIQFLLLDSYYGDHLDTMNQLHQPSTSPLPIQRLNEWNMKNGSTEYQQVYHALTSDWPKFYEMLQNQSTSRLIEVLLQISPNREFQALYDQCFKSQLYTIIRHPVSNYIIQKLIEYTRNEAQYRDIWIELQTSLGDLFKGRLGVLLKMAQVALRYPAIQSQILQGISSCIAQFCAKRDSMQPKTPSGNLPSGKYSPVNSPSGSYPSLDTQSLEDAYNLVHYLLYLYPPSSNISKYAISPLGVQILSQLFYFQSQLIQPLLNAFLKLDYQILGILVMDVNGSRMIEHYFKSTSIVDQDTQQLIQNILTLQSKSIVLDKNGSHIIEICFEKATIEQKRTLANSLVLIESEIKQLPYGRCVWFKLNLEKMKNTPKEWEEAEKNRMKNRKMFQDILTFPTSSGKVREGVQKAAEVVEGLESRQKRRRSQENRLAPVPKRKNNQEVDQEALKVKEKRQQEEEKGDKYSEKMKGEHTESKHVQNVSIGQKNSEKIVEKETKDEKREKRKEVKREKKLNKEKKKRKDDVKKTDRKIK